MDTAGTISRILIVEDLPRTRAWLAAIVARAFPMSDCRQTGSLAETQAILDGFAPQLALIDLGLPDGSGLDIIRRIAQTLPGCLRIVLTIYSDDSHLFPALRAGADGYLLKDLDEDEQVHYLTGLANGTPALSPAIAQRLIGVFRNYPDENRTESPLTPRETDVLGLIGKGYSIEQCANSLELSANTVSTHLKHIYRKLDINSRAQASFEAMRLGLLSSAN